MSYIKNLESMKKIHESQAELCKKQREFFIPRANFLLRNNFFKAFF